jgi:tetratricopeptide (TPR) repeat protein
MLRPVLLLSAALLSTSTLAKAQQAGAISPYAAYLFGRHALASGDRGQGVEALEALAVQYPEQPALRLQAFQAALFAGDIEGAAKFAPDGPSADDPADFESLGRIVRAVEALSANKPADAARQLDLKSVEIPFRSAAFMLRPWVLAANGDWTGALAQPNDGDRVAVLVAGLGRAQLFEIRGKRTEAEAAYKDLVADAIGQKLFKVRYGEFLERTGRAKEAIAIYDGALKSEPDNAELVAARERAARGGRPPAAPNLRQGAAQALTFAAAAMSNRVPAIGLDYLRLALKLDPTLDQALIMLGEDMEDIRDGSAAREAWSKVPVSSRLYVDARTREAYSLSGDGDNEGAIKLARAVAVAQPHDAAAQFALADILRSAEKDADALAVLDQIEKTDGGQDWRVRYMRAITLDTLGRWSESEVELKKALDQEPDQPDVENYLGYSWIDHGDHVKDGMALVEKAVAARPNSGAMQDSLGWAHYRLGDYKAAVSLLEKAVELEPADPDINDHLGDAYFMAGRKDEAGFQWNRVLSLSPDAKLKAAVERKLKDGVSAKVAAR